MKVYKCKYCKNITEEDLDKLAVSPELWNKKCYADTKSGTIKRKGWAAYKNSDGSIIYICPKCRNNKKIIYNCVQWF